MGRKIGNGSFGEIYIGIFFFNLVTLLHMSFFSPFNIPSYLQTRLLEFSYWSMLLIIVFNRSFFFPAVHVETSEIVAVKMVSIYIYIC